MLVMIDSYGLHDLCDMLEYNNSAAVRVTDTWACIELLGNMWMMSFAATTTLVLEATGQDSGEAMRSAVVVISQSPGSQNPLCA